MPRVGCRTGPFFPLAALQTAPPLATEAAPEAAEAIGVFLRGGEGRNWPQDGWRVLEILEEERATFVHPGSAESPRVAFMSTDWVAGGWQWSGASAPNDCVLVAEPDADAGAPVDWVLDPAAGELSADSTQIALLATEMGCASGEPMGDRLRGPIVVTTGDAVRIGLTVEPLIGDQDCPGNPSQPVVIELDEALGERAVRDLRATDLGELSPLLLELIDAMG